MGGGGVHILTRYRSCVCFAHILSDLPSHQTKAYVLHAVCYVTWFESLFFMKFGVVSLAVKHGWPFKEDLHLKQK